MGMEFRKKLALLSDSVGVEDAERLLEWLQNKPAAKVDLSALYPYSSGQHPGAAGGWRAGKRLGLPTSC